MQLRQFPRDRPVPSLLLAVLVVEIVGASGSIFTIQSLVTWYRTLEQPALAPPDWVFGPVWTTLFLLKGVAAWLVWRRWTGPDAMPDRVRTALGLFGLQFVFNLGWSAVFFGLQSISLGLVVILVLVALIALTIRAFDRVDRRAALLLVPYLLWVGFATYLTYQFWVLN